MPGKSISVKSHAFGERRSTITSSVENLLVPRQNISVAEEMRLHKLPAFAASLRLELTLVDTNVGHFRPKRAFLMTSLIGHLVTRQVPLGKMVSPANKFRREILPEDWSLRTHICGKLSSNSKLRFHKSSANLNHGRMSLSISADRRDEVDDSILTAIKVLQILSG